MKKIFTIEGMHCNSCAMLIEKEFKDKVNDISVSFADEKAEIDFDENKISKEEITGTIKGMGFEASEVEQKVEEEKKQEDKCLDLTK
jgi:cation transport ATPase